MLNIEIIETDGRSRRLRVPDECLIGKGAQNEIRLDSWRVSKEHARLFSTPSGVLLEDVGAFAGVSVNGQRIDTQYGPLRKNDVIGIGPFKLRVHADEGPPVSPPPLSHSPSPKRSSGDEHPSTNTLTSPALTVSASNLARVERDDTSAAVSSSVHLTSDDTDSAKSAGSSAHRALEFEWRKRIHAVLLDTMDLRRHDVSRMSDDKLRAETDALIQQILKDLDAQIPSEIDRELLSRQVLNEAVGLGPLEELLDDHSVTEIMVNRYDQIYVERAGRLERHPLTFTGDRAVMGVIERIVAPIGRRIDESSPMVDARLKDGSRVNAIIPPLALKGPTLTIRKFSKRKLTVEDLQQYGSISAEMSEFLRICVEFRKNVIVSGGTGSGKTTLLNILSNFIPSGERVITVEDAAELQLHHEHLINLEARPANVEGKGAVLIRDLVKNTLRMRPDRIVVGECRGAEALDMLQAMNTGHEGSLTTLHANSARDALARLETMVLMAGMELPLLAIREQIASAVDVIVQQTRFSCGSRLVTSIVEVTGMESGKIQIQELFRFVDRGYPQGVGRIQGDFTGCGLVPTFCEALIATGKQIDMDIFRPRVKGFSAIDSEAHPGLLE